ncbi:hypothetical protein [Priestia taiwanensis]|uniref:Uncharacterized protein n=1 Tax=Priestia taiwanensis TaxID=1347902 RepID=A0A917AW88_9BACI|nr:hypothetical protein [Priestia taiwanensis]MBM7363656.1 hypothetical protein [Priestia taiwanensis]GGE75162.1 hypothetical protein GCM10007140_26300 [Priestia taiwanensis]
MENVRRLAFLGVVASVLIFGAIRLHAFINIQDLMEYAKFQEETLIDIKDDGEVYVAKQTEEVIPSVENVAELLAVAKNTDNIAKKVFHFDKKMSVEEVEKYYSSAWEDRDFLLEEEENVDGEKDEIAVALADEFKRLQLDASDFFDEIAIFDWEQHKNFFSFISKVHIAEQTGDLFYQDTDEIVAKLKKMSPEEYEDYMQNIHYLINGRQMLEDINLLKKVF